MLQKKLKIILFISLLAIIIFIVLIGKYLFLSDKLVEKNIENTLETVRGENYCENNDDCIDADQISRCENNRCLKVNSETKEKEQKTLKFIKEISLTEVSDGQIIRPALTYNAGKFSVGYTNADETKFYGSTFSTAFAKEITKPLVDNPPMKTAMFDMQTTTDGTYIYAAYGLVTRLNQSSTIKSVYLTKYDSGWNIISGPVEVFTLTNPDEENDEHGDDPSPFLSGEALYLETHVGSSEKENGTLRIRKFDKNLNPLYFDGKSYIDLELNSPAPRHSVASELIKDGKIYILTTIIPEGNKNNSDVYIYRYNFDGEFDNFSLPVANDPRISEARPMDFKYVDGKFYTVYAQVSFGPGGKDNMSVIFFNIYDENFTFLDNIQVTEDNIYANQPSAEIIGNKIYIAYRQAPQNNQKESTLRLKVYEWQ